MKKFYFVLSALLVLGFAVQARAETSSTAYTGKDYTENEVFIYAYNNSGSSIQSNGVVIIDTSGTAGSTLGAYITTTSTADSVYVCGVTDETIADGAVGRVCVKGPHLVMYTSSTHTAGTIAATSTTAAQATTYSTADGIAGGQLGVVIGATSALGTRYAWVYIRPNVHK
jgi:hypothetical protein